MNLTWAYEPVAAELEKERRKNIKQVVRRPKIIFKPLYKGSLNWGLISKNFKGFFRLHPEHRLDLLTCISDCESHISDILT